MVFVNTLLLLNDGLCEQTMHILNQEDHVSDRSRGIINFGFYVFVYS